MQDSISHIVRAYLRDNGMKIDNRAAQWPLGDDLVQRRNKRLATASAALKTNNSNSAISQLDMSTPDALHDPDPFTAVCMVIAGVAGIAQIVGTAHGMWPKRSSRLGELSQFVTELENDLEDLIRTIERLQRFLRNHNCLEGRPVLGAPNQFGAAPMALSDHDFNSYDGIVGKLINDVLKLNSRTIGVIRFHPEFASHLGADILQSFSDIIPRINRLRDASIGDALDLSLEILREIDRIVRRLTAEPRSN